MDGAEKNTVLLTLLNHFMYIDEYLVRSDLNKAQTETHKALEYINNLLRKESKE